MDSVKSPGQAPGNAARTFRVLHVAAEMFPLVKTGGLADVVAALMPELARQGSDVRILLPGFAPVIEALSRLRVVASLPGLFGAGVVRLLKGQLPGGTLTAYCIESPYLYRRDGGPYHDDRGREWPDNLQRFAMLGWVAAHLASGELDEGWTPQVVHAHDWHAAMACAYIAAHPPTQAASVFTLHNLVYQGLFDRDDFRLLGLPARFQASAALEFHGQVSFIKAGLKFADRITVVSPTYAREITTPEFGAGLDGVIRARGTDVVGILNGIDAEVWNPARDAALPHAYDIDRPDGKSICRRSLQQEVGLAVDAEALLLVVVSRFTRQKGLDLLLEAVSMLMNSTGGAVQIALQGSGDADLVEGWRGAERMYPGRVAVRVGYDEGLAHRLIAGGDMIVVPSRFEPCGLTQMYGMRYGTLPLVRRVGGLADTVTDARDEGKGTGVTFDEADPVALAQAVRRAMELKRDAALWTSLIRRAMGATRRWNSAAFEYLTVYDEACRDRKSRPRTL